MIVEDDEQALDTCQDCVNDFEKDNSCNIDLIKCKTLSEALSELNMSFDGIIIDIKLGTQGTGDEGNKILEKIGKTNLRIPTVILTATPGSVEKKPNYIGIFKKGDIGSGYNDLLNYFWDIYNTGLTNIMGGRGKIEEVLGYVFNENLMPEQYRKKWIEYGKTDTSRTERALLRHAISHLLQILDDEHENFFPEEVYLAPPLGEELRTGSIVENKDNKQLFIIMTPACDIVTHNGSFKTDRILIVEIEVEATVINYVMKDVTKDDEKTLKISQLFGNNFCNYYHWLPKTDFFRGGFINFRKIFSLKPGDFKKIYDILGIQIAPSFIKDIVGRFASYYARQGQPDIEKSDVIKQVILQHNKG
jgi:hypothetical protein